MLGGMPLRSPSVARRYHGVRHYLRFSLFRHNPCKPFRYLSMRLLMLSTLLLATTACTWVPIEPAGKTVRVLAAGAVPAGCQSKGEIVVTVKNKVGFYNRNPLRVQEELETLARNEAPSASANAVQASAPPADGSQRFAAFQCPPR